MKELNKYKHNGFFIFKATNNLNKVCNAPSDKAGIYLIYALKSGHENLIYIGRSGKKEIDGSFFIRKGGIKDRLINGKRDGELRKLFWIREIIKNEFDGLKICWFATHDDEYSDCPTVIETALVGRYKPLWNR